MQPWPAIRKDRCLSSCATHDATHWPDTPWDQQCTGSPCNHFSPTFWSTRRLSSLTTRVWTGTAYADVENALTDLHALSDEVVSLRAAVSASQNYLQLAQVQYKYGLVDYLIVIDAERTLLANQLLLAQTVNLQMGASIHLIKALGGGWENRP